MERGPLACTDAERRAAVAMAGELRAAGRDVQLQARWVRPGWPAWQALCAAAGVVGTVLGVSHPVAGLVVSGAGLAVGVAYGRGRLVLGRARATQDVVAPARAPGRVAVVVLAAVDRPRTAILTHVPPALEWVLGALALATALAAARAAGVDGTLLAAARLVPAALLLVAAAGLLEAAAAPPRPADDAATQAAATLGRAAPWAEIVLVGAGELGLRARLRADRRPAEDVVLVWLDPAPVLGWRTAHPTLAALTDASLAAEPGLRARRLRGRALPAGGRPALALLGPPGALTDFALAVAARLGEHLGVPARAK